MKGRTNADSEKKSPCPAKDKLDPSVETVFGRPTGKGGYGTGPIVNPDGAGFINPPTASQQKRLDAEKKAKDSKRKQSSIKSDGSLNEVLERADEMKSGDIFLKWSEEPDSTHISVRQDSITLCTSQGLEGIKIKKGGSAEVQGELVVKNLGFQITKGWFTENPLSWIPSTLYTEIPGYLFKLPISGLLNGVTGLLKTFLSDFYKG